MSPTYFTSNSPSGKKIAEAIERLKVKKQSLHITNKQISDNSKGVLSESAVQRFFSGENADPSMQTFVEIATAMGMTIEESFGIQSAPIVSHHHTDHDICEKRIAEQKAHYEEQLAQCRTRYSERIADHKEAHHREVSRLNKWLMFTSAAFIILTLFVLTFTLIDVTSNDVGWIRYDEYLKLISEDTTTNGLIKTIKEFFRRIFDGNL